MTHYISAKRNTSLPGGGTGRIMFSRTSRTGAVRNICKACQASRQQDLRRSSTRLFSNRQAAQSGPHQSYPVFVILAIGVGAGLYARSQGLGPRELYAEEPAVPADVIRFEKPKKRKGPSKEDNRDAISSQHQQVKRSWENPGVYAWGSNSGKVVAPDSDEPNIKNPRRIPFFDGMLLRDMKLDRNFGAAITENGDLLQWGAGYSTDLTEPNVTLKGKNLTSLAISRDRIFVLSSSGQVYSIPVSREDQLSGPKLRESTWLPFWRVDAPISYRVLQPSLSSWSERITAVSSGIEHGLLLTSAGRLFSFASSSTSYPSRSQLGVPGIASWEDRPSGPYDQPHLIATLQGFPISAVAAGDYHSLALDSAGRVFSFGDNSCGQLGLDMTSESPYIDAPSLVPISRLYTGASQTPVVTSIAAGGTTSFLTVDATKVASSTNRDPSSRSQINHVTAETFACGQGIYGTLGTGRWTHVQGTPTRIKALSGLYEYDEKSQKVVPIRLAHLSVGSTHAAAVMDNVTHLGAHSGSSENDTNWGADVLWWGGNEFYQLGTGRRNNVNTPQYIGPLDAVESKGKREEHRFQITPKKRVNVRGRMVEMEQRVECGRMCTAVYSKCT